jgi:riboflavin biosynthesis pyrimidine reductase
MRAEGYGRVVSDPAKRELRERAGLPPDPLMVIVSNRLALPWDAPLFTDGGGSVVVFTASADAPPATATPVEVIRHDNRVDLVEMVRWLRTERGIRSLLCEGGPTLHAELVAAQLVDELFVTRAPRIAGGTGPGIFAGLEAGTRELELVWLFEAGGELYARYRLT